MHVYILVVLRGSGTHRALSLEMIFVYICGHHLSPRPCEAAVFSFRGHYMNGL